MAEYGSSDYFDPVGRLARLKDNPAGQGRLYDPAMRGLTAAQRKKVLERLAARKAKQIEDEKAAKVAARGRDAASGNWRASKEQHDDDVNDALSQLRGK